MRSAISRVLRMASQVVREEDRHLRRRLQVELVDSKRMPVRRVEVGDGSDAQQDVVGVVLVAPDVVQIVRHDVR